jgi:tetratricopeptide (TPR) repeat protein
MPPISQRFSIPKADGIFEEMCLELLRLYWSRSGLELFAKRGERQYGIDILDVGGEIPIYAAQCKLKEEHKSLSPTEIQDEVDKAKQFTPPLGRYGILTTAKVSGPAQRKLREINQLHRRTGLFEVQLLTWDRLCALLQQYDEVQDRFYGGVGLGQAKRVEAQLLTIKDGVQSLTSKIEGDGLESEINEARDCIGRGEFQFAIFLLNRIQRTHGDRLTARQKFRVIANHGAATLGIGKAEDAARLFLEAAQWQPQDEQGKTNVVLARLLVGDATSCHAQASLLRKEYPGSGRLAALWVNSAPKETSLAESESEISSVLRTDPEVSIALARRALAEFDFDSGLKYARSASVSAPKWSQAQLVLAQIYLGKALRARFGPRTSPFSEESTLVEAERACSKALALSLAEDHQTQAMALVLRVDIRLLLKKTPEAIEDANSAERLNPEDSGVMLAVAQARFAADRIEDGIAMLKKAYRLSQRPDIAFSYGKALQNRGRDEDVAEALEVFTRISLREIPSDLRPTTAANTIQCFSKKKDWQGAEAYLAISSSVLDPATLTILRGYLAHYQDQPQEADRCAAEAHTLINPGATAEAKHLQARLLMMIGRPAEALPVWQDLFQQDAPGLDPNELLACAAKLQRDDVVMQTCEQLRKRGIDDWNLVEFEIQYLEKYKIDAAIDLLRAFIAKHSDNNVLAKIRLSLIGLRLNRPSLVQAEMENLPAVAELPLRYAIPVVQVLKYGGQPTAAVRFAYEFLRVHFNEIEAHQALILSMMPGTFAPDIPARLEVAGPDSAVCYQELPSTNTTWVVLEDTNKPNGDFEEIPLASALAIELTGKRIGDTVVLAKGSMQSRHARILEILPKYVRRFQDVMGEMQVRFGAASSVESIRVEGEDGTQSKGIEVLLSSVEKRAAAVVDVRASYTNQPLSLHLYGHRFDRNAFQALLSLAEEEEQPIKCCTGNSEERIQAVQALQTAKAIVVDISSLATLRLLHQEKILSSTRFHFIMSERTWVTFHEMLSESRLSAPTGTLYYKDGKHFMYEESDEDRQRRHRQDEDFVHFLEKTTERRNGLGLAALQPEKRQVLEKFFGTYGAESMLLASDPDYVLWTDDLIQGQVAAQEFGSRRVWTQLVLGSLTDAGLLNSEEYSEASARLIGAEFVATLFDSSSMLAAFRMASWSGGNKPAAQVVKIFADPGSDLQSLLRIYADFTVRLYREPIEPDVRCSVTRALLDALARRPEVLELLEKLRKISARIFGMNAVGNEQFDKCFDRWIGLRGKPIIHFP